MNDDTRQAVETARQAIYWKLDCGGAVIGQEWIRHLDQFEAAVRSDEQRRLADADRDNR